MWILNIPKRRWRFFQRTDATAVHSQIETAHTLWAKHCFPHGRTMLLIMHSLPMWLAYSFIKFASSECKSYMCALYMFHLFNSYYWWTQEHISAKAANGIIKLDLSKCAVILCNLNVSGVCICRGIEWLVYSLGLIGTEIWYDLITCCPDSNGAVIRLKKLTL